MTSISVREYVDADAKAVLALVHELQGHEAQLFDRMKPPSEIGPWYLKYLLEDTAKHDGALLVADTGETIAGYASLLARYEEDAVDEVSYTYAYVGDLVVGNSFRRKGVGALLIDVCEERARAAGQKWLRLSVLASNAGSRAFYERSGFHEHLITLEKQLL